MAVRMNGRRKREPDEFDAWIEQVSLQSLDPESDDAQQDPCRPPIANVQVRCLHCGGTYQSRDMKWEKRTGTAWPLWWCPKSTCDGAGFGFDLKELNAARDAGRREVE